MTGKRHTMTCKHEPKDPIAEFAHVCKHCGQDIEVVHCKKCDGTGSPSDGGLYECRRCRGTGIERWVICAPTSNAK